MLKKKVQFIKIVKNQEFQCSEPMKHMDKLVEIFVKCDDFYKDFEAYLNEQGLQDPIKKTRL